MKRIIVSVTNDLAGDNRVHRVCLTLVKMGYSVLLVGRRLETSSPLSGRGYETHRIRLRINKGPLFYAEYNFRLWMFLLFHHFDLLLANDLDTLPANRIAGLLKRKPVIYDSHEYFTEVPELIGRPGVTKIWEWLEKQLVPGVDAAYTVCQTIADVYTRKYGVPFAVVRNLPLAGSFPESPPAHRQKRISHPEQESPGEEVNLRITTSENEEIHPPLVKKKITLFPLYGVQSPTIIYQGALNLGRGLEQAIRAMQYLPEATLLLVGSGDLDAELRSLASSLNLENVRFPGRIPLEELVLITRQARLGISIEEDLGLNYRYALPNKLFDYIQARIPVVVSDLPEMSQIVRHYDIGLINPSLQPEVLAETFRTALTDESLRRKWLENLPQAATKLTWENEEPKIIRIFERFS